MQIAQTDGAVSNILYVSVPNPAPSINKVTITDHTVSIVGANFVNGATILWDGQVLSATLNDAGRLQTSVTDQWLAFGPAIDIAVANPAPGGGASNVVTLQLNQQPDPVSETNKVYLPIVLQ